MNITSRQFRHGPVKPVLAPLFFIALTIATPAANQFWDNNGTSAATSGTWDTTTKNWASSSTLTASTAVYVNGNFPEFAAGSGTTTAITITVNSAVTCAGMATGLSGATVKTLTFSGSGSIGIASGLQGVFCGGSSADGLVIQVPLTGTGGIEQQSSGSLSLYASNSYTGGTETTGGQVVNYNQNSSFGTGTITVAGSTGAFVNGAATNVTIANAVVILNPNYNVNFAGGLPPSSGVPGTTFTGPFTLPSGTTTFYTGGSPTGQLIEISGAISGSGANLAVSDNGTLWLAGANTFTGSIAITNPAVLVIVGSGSLTGGNYSGNITNFGSFTYNSSVNQTLSGVISGTGALTQNGTGSLTLQGANTYTGNTVISNGTLYLAAGSSINNTALVNIISGATLDVSGADPFTLGTGATLSANGNGTGVAASVLNNSGASGTINLGSQPINLTFTPASSAGDSSDPALYVPAGTITLGGNNRFTVNNASGAALGAGIYTLIQQASGNIVSAGGYSVAVTGSGLAAGNLAFIQVSGGAVNLVVEAPLNSQTWNGNDFTNFTIWSDATNWVSVTAPDLFGDNVYFDGTNGLAPVMDQSYIVDSLTFNSTAGAFTLSAAGTNVLTVGTGVTNNSANLETLGLPVQMVDLGQLGQSQWNISGGPITVNSPISDTGNADGLAVTGANTLTLNAVNTYTGPTSIGSGAVVSLIGAAQLASGAYPGAIANAGTLNYGSSASQTLAGAISGAGAINQNGPGQLNLAGVNTFTGPINIASGTTLAVTGGGKLGNGTYSIDLVDNGTLVYNSTAVQILGGTLSGNGALTHSGTGTLTLSGTNTYTNITSIGNGSLQITNDVNLGAPPAVYVSNQLYMNCAINNGANNYGLRVQGSSFALNANRGITLGPLGGSINVQNGDTFTVNSIITGPGPFYSSPNSSAGYGTVLLNAANTYTGPTLIGAGTLSLGGNGYLPFGTPVTVGSSQQGAANGSFFNMAGFSQTIGPLASSTGLGGAGTGLPTITTSGGALTILQTNVNTTFVGAITGTGGSVTLTIPVGGTPGILTFSGTNTYTGATTINTGATLALSAKGAISNSATLAISAGGTLDVTALSTNFYLSASTTLNASGTGTTAGSTAAIIKGAAALTNNLEARPILLIFTPASANGDTTHPALYISQGKLGLNGNAITVNNASGTPLNAGTYTLIQVASGTTIGTPNATPIVTGSGLVAGTTATVAVSGGNVNLVVKGATAFSNLTASQSINYGSSPTTLAGTISANGPVYPASGETIKVTVNGNVQTTTISDSTGDFSINYNSAAIPASATPYTITYGYAGDASFIGVTNTSTTLTVGQTNQTITFGSLADQTYSVAPFALTATASSGLPISYSVQSGPASVASSTLTVTGAGSVTIQASQTGNVDYTAALPVTQSFTVNPLAVSLSGTRNYDGTNDATNTILTVTNIVGSDNVTIASGSAMLSSPDIGTNAIIAFTNLVLGGTADTNYTLTGATGFVTVTPLPVLLGGTRPYDGTNDADSSILNLQNDFDGTNLSLSGSAVLAGATAGPESITVFTNLTLNGSAATNYTLTNASGSVTVTSLPLTITATGQSKTYGTAFSPGTTAFSVGGSLFGSESVTAVILTTSGGVGVTDPVTGSPYTITPSGATGTGGFLATNYNITYVPGTLTVHPLAVYLTGTRPYDGTTAASASILAISDVVSNDDVNLASGAAVLAGPGVGAEAITSMGTLVLGGVTAPDYTLVGGTGSVAVTANALTIAANPQGKVYGVALSLGTTAFTVGGSLPNSESVTGVTLTANGGTAANAPVAGSPYTINPSAAIGANGFLAANYNITYVTNALTVSNLPVVLTGVRGYDATSIAVAGILSVSNAVGGDDVGVASGSASLVSSNVGVQLITNFLGLTLGGTTAGNYTIAGATGSVSITNQMNPFMITTSALDATGSNFVVCWQSVPGVVYTVLTNAAIGTTNWAVTGSPITASNTTTCYSLPVVPGGAVSTFVQIKQK